MKNPSAGPDKAIRRDRTPNTLFRREPTTRCRRSTTVLGPIVIAFLTFLAILSTEPAFAVDPVYSNWRGLAVRGADPVAYFTDGKPIEGSSDHTLEYMGASWRFASAQNLAAFSANPEKFSPQYGGYCAWAVSQGYTASSDPEAWTIVDGKLYLNYSEAVMKDWLADRDRFIREANANWPEIRNE